MLSRDRLALLIRPQSRRSPTASRSCPVFFPTPVCFLALVRPLWTLPMLRSEERGHSRRLASNPQQAPLGRAGLSE